METHYAELLEGRNKDINRKEPEMKEILLHREGFRNKQLSSAHRILFHIPELKLT
jgi:hypothetical protein